MHKESVEINDGNDILQINILNKELESLRNELKSKDEIISTLTKEGNVINYQTSKANNVFNVESATNNYTTKAKLN